MSDLAAQPLISMPIQLMLWFSIAVVLYLSFSKVQYQGLITNPARQTGLLACALVFTILWRIKAGILPGLDLHILGVTAVTLTLGWRFALVSATLAGLLLTAFSQISVSSLPASLLLGAYLPILLSYGIFVLCYHFLPRHFFIYIFVCAFLCAALIACFKIVLISAFYYLTGNYTGFELTENYLYLCAIIWFPEAMLNGMAITVLITYRPHWVKTFYDKDYLDS
ncbi:MAG: energy-coupling factor ABC transporter permease [Pseudoalteromonas sp.]|uniref:energy-coupling factor ABC transporter permease n=1 Tax=unclassified Pseudoalteromonas TaxID=194690 RepID=UPI003F98DF25